MNESGTPVQCEVNKSFTTIYARLYSPRDKGGHRRDIKGCFLRTRNSCRFFRFYENVPGSPHTSSYMSGHHPATVRRAGRKRGARFESSEALAEQPAVARSAVELHRCCARVSRAAALRRSSVNILTAWPGRVAQASRAGRARAPWSCSPCWRPSRDAHGSGIS